MQVLHNRLFGVRGDNEKENSYDKRTFINSIRAFS